MFGVQPQPVGCNLGKRGPGTLTHVVGSRLHQAGPVASHHRTSLALEHQRRKSRGADSPTDKQARLVTRLSWCERAS